MKGHKFLRKLHDKCLIFVLIFTLLVFRPDKSYAVPKFLNYQGKLSDASGAPVANGTYQVTFSIYDAPAGGTPLWTETLNVPVNNGVFAVELGKVTTMPATLISAPSLFLGVKVGSDPEMTPRSPLHPVPRAFLSEKAEDADKLGGQAIGNFVLKLDPKWNVLSNDDGTVNNADSQHTHTVGSVSGTVLLNPSSTQVIQPSGDFPSLAIKLSPGQTKPLLTLQNDAGTILGGLASQGLFGIGGLQLNAEGPAATTVNVLNADPSNVANLNVEGSVTAKQLTLLADTKWNLLTNQDGTVDNADTMHSHSGGGGGGSILLSPTSPQTIQPTVDATPLILKSGVASPTVPLFEVQDSSGGKKLAVMQDGHVLIPAPNLLHVRDINNDSPTGPMGNMIIDVMNNTGNSKLNLANSDPSFTAGLSVEGSALIGNPSDVNPQLSVESGSAFPTIAAKQTLGGTALDVWNAGTGPGGVFSITDPSNSQPLIKGDHGGTGNLLQLSKGGISKFVVDNAGNVTAAGNLIKTNPGSMQTIQPIGNITPLQLKAGISLPDADMLQFTDVSSLPLFEVTANADLIWGTIVSAPTLQVQGPGANLTLDVNGVGATKVTVTNTLAGLADLEVEGVAKIKGGTRPLLAGASLAPQLGVISVASICESIAADQLIIVTFPAGANFTLAPTVVATETTSGAGYVQSVTGVTTTGATINLGGGNTGTVECVNYIAVGQI